MATLKVTMLLKFDQLHREWFYLMTLIVHEAVVCLLQQNWKIETIESTTVTIVLGNVNLMKFQLFEST